MRIVERDAFMLEWADEWTESDPPIYLGEGLPEVDEETTAVEGGRLLANTTWDNVKGYLQDGDKVKPPTGSAYVNGTAEEIDATSYAVTSTNDGYRATLKMKTSGEKTAGDFTTKTSSTNGSGQGSSSSGDNTGSGNE